MSEQSLYALFSINNGEIITKNIGDNRELWGIKPQTLPSSI